MRIHARKLLSYALLGTSAVFFVVTMHKTNEDLSALDLDVNRLLPQTIPGSDVRLRSSAFNRSTSASTSLWLPDPEGYDDRIVRQMAHVPECYAPSAPLKYIFVPGGIWDTPMGQSKFVEESCPVNRCALTTHRPSRADAVLIQNSLDGASLRKHPNQIWILWILESPLNSIGLAWLHDKINWTASYRSDSTIVTPYEKFVPYANASRLPRYPQRNYADGKTKLVAWFVSNCNAANRRLEYVRELRKYVSVDVFGSCGNKRCIRDKRGGHCDAMLSKDYKFYLSFENSNCEYYITEKLFWNALFNDIVPVVMGARKADYLAAAPRASFIHVEDFSSAQHLAEYLLKLDADDRLYNEFFRWKDTGRFINTKFWCRMCAMLHDVNKPVTWYTDVEKWWRHNGTCTRDRWDRPGDVITDWKTSVINK